MPDIDAEVERRRYELAQARTAYDLAVREQWRVHGEKWLARLRAEHPTPPDGIETVRRQTLSDPSHGMVINARVVEHIAQWQGEPWHSAAYIMEDVWTARGIMCDGPEPFYRATVHQQFGMMRVAPANGAAWLAFRSKYGR